MYKKPEMLLGIYSTIHSVWKIIPKKSHFEFWRPFLFVLICQNRPISTADFNQNSPHFVIKNSENSLN